MKKMALTTGMLLMLWFATAMFASMPAQAGNGVGQQWLATGIVTRVGTDVIYLLGKDDVIYRINTSRAKILFSNIPGRLENIQVGDRVRVFGKKTGSRDIRAIQMNILGTAPRQEAPIVAPETVPPPEVPAPLEPEVPSPGTAVPAPEQPYQGTGPSISGIGGGPAVGPPSFTARGLVKDLHLTEGWITVLTADGPVVVDIDSARIFSNGSATTKADISSGDAVSIVGDHVATGKVTARTLDILSSKNNADSARPVTAVSEVGTITSLDYNARTFVIDTASSGSVFVMADDSTTLLSAGGEQMAFTALKPGTRVKVSGVGSLGTGYLARQIFVIGAPR